MPEIKYRAIISDIDGTLTPNEPGALPSDRVSKSIRQAEDSGATFSLASGRPFSLMEYLVKHLKLTSPMITDNGAIIADGKDGSILWEVSLSRETSLAIIELTRSSGLTRVSTNNGVIENPTNLPNDAKIRKVSVHDMSIKEADALIEKVTGKIKNIATVRAASYRGEGFLDIYFSHAEATKQHAVLKYAEILGISPTEIIAVGDGYNDYSLLMTCGLKVAMGNAVQELKDIADLVVPSVDEDGLAVMIEKLVVRR